MRIGESAMENWDMPMTESVNGYIRATGLMVILGYAYGREY